MTIDLMYKQMLITLFAVLSLPLIFYFLTFHGSLSVKHDRWAEFGSYLSGTYGTFAFIILAYTTNITRRQFTIQNEDNIFFKLYESLKNRIDNSLVVIDNTEHTKHKTLMILANRFREELSETTLEIARVLLCKAPENINDIHYMKIFMATRELNFIDSFSEYKTDFISKITAQPDFNTRWEVLEFYIGSRGQESGDLRNALQAIGSVNFYKIPFPERRHYYNLVAQTVIREHGEFLDGYFRNICFLVEFATKSYNRDIYIKFIKSQLTKYELIIIFYLIAGRDGKLGNMKNLLDLGIIDGLLTIGCQSLMLDFPSTEELKIELINVFNDQSE
ncbi:MAG: putative phage abortive infection protein [Methylococcaceae bacterium]|nr:putative phage abortive infection protein [Methylococcaceae bacterium]